MTCLKLRNASLHARRSAAGDLKHPRSTRRSCDNGPLDRGLLPRGARSRHQPVEWIRCSLLRHKQEVRFTYIGGFVGQLVSGRYGWHRPDVPRGYQQRQEW